LNTELGGFPACTYGSSAGFLRFEMRSLRTASLPAPLPYDREGGVSRPRNRSEGYSTRLGANARGYSARFPAGAGRGREAGDAAAVGRGHIPRPSTKDWGEGQFRKQPRFANRASEP
jgi:hypothetical protein